MTTATLEGLAAQVADLPADRRGVLIDQLESTMAEEQQGGRDVEGQLDLFGFKAMVESDDHLKTVTLEQIASAYGISTASLQRYIRAGELVATRFGRKYVITIAELKQFLSRPRLKAKQGQGTKTKATSGKDRHAQKRRAGK